MTTSPQEPGAGADEPYRPVSLRRLPPVATAAADLREQWRKPSTVAPVTERLTPSRRVDLAAPPPLAAFDAVTGWGASTSPDQGLSSVTVRESGPVVTVAVLSLPTTWVRKGDAVAGSRNRATEAAATSGVTAVPSEHVTPCLSVKVALFSVDVQSEASPAISSPVDRGGIR